MRLDIRRRRTPDIHALAVPKQRDPFIEYAEVCAGSLPELMEGPPPDLFRIAINAELGPALNRHMRASTEQRPAPRSG
jgi:hypothetical protein